MIRTNVNLRRFINIVDVQIYRDLYSGSLRRCAAEALNEILHIMLIYIFIMAFGFRDDYRRQQRDIHTDILTRKLDYIMPS